MQGPVLLPSSPPALPSPFAPCGSCRKHLKPSGSWREPTRLKSRWCEPGNAPGCLSACQHGQESQEGLSPRTDPGLRSLRAAGIAFPPAPWSGGSPAPVQNLQWVKH